MNAMIGRLGLPLLVAGWLSAGCGAGPTMGESTETLQASSLPDVPSCDARSGLPHGALTAKRIAGAGDLVVVYDDGAPLCIDVLPEAAHLLGSFIVLQGAGDSNPMPGDDTRGGSNPMPGAPTDPASSNPMPGDDTRGNSNPMPGEGK